MSSKACHEYEELVYMHSEGVLAPGDARRLERHLTECAACRNVLTELRALEQALREMPREPAPQGFAAAVSRRLASLEPEWRRRDAAWDWLPWPRAARRASAIAFAGACAIVLIAVAYVLLPASVAQSLPADAV
ncbi:MAG: anti-sigma factor family protein, partial [Armatimonadota bacterium]